jgi:CHAD domain-containing protein
LHRWRLAAKRLRYALELAVVSLPKPIWTRLYQLLSDLQERLGVICDHLVERERLSRFRCESGDAQERRVLDKLAAESRRKLAAAKQGLGRWWTASRRRQVQSLCRRAVAV